MADMHGEIDSNAQPAGKAGFPVVPLALVAAGGAAAGVLAWAWMNFGEAIYLNRLAAVVANCF